MKKPALLIALICLPYLLSPPAARAELVTTGQVAASSERDRVNAMLARPEVVQKLKDYGVMPGDAQGRVDALTDQEVTLLAQRIDTLAAGALSDTQWLLVVIAVLLILIAL